MDKKPTIGRFITTKPLLLMFRLCAVELAAGLLVYKFLQLLDAALLLSVQAASGAAISFAAFVIFYRDG
ncbi:hypothetical protein [Bartonella sp. CL45QHWL]|uniref:hypothetical protein n=1 Tax=Bartonella sp. CL45QHWL TaxID=3243533 RepID=UPI0035D0E7C4